MTGFMTLNQNSSFTKGVRSFGRITRKSKTDALPLVAHELYLEETITADGRRRFERPQAW
jgi:hypothetical protein